MKEELIAPCGMNCAICVAYFGYRMDGGRRKTACSGCRIKNKDCAFVKKQCELLSKHQIEYCFECDHFPCEQLKKLDKRYRIRFNMSSIENLENIRDNGVRKFLKQQRTRYRCPECGGTICVHTNRCYSCS
ncbi:MAG: DUF3795 domain-containing protein [Candidatus Thorarchaeota archaeon SMTZ1-45]|nr:MAG: hypothetical protein AM325_07725 [Candidatus Thorarchaeota archaeon SMTZ1-45]